MYAECVLDKAGDQSSSPVKPLNLVTIPNGAVLYSKKVRNLFGVQDGFEESIT